MPTKSQAPTAVGEPTTDISTDGDLNALLTQVEGQVTVSFETEDSDGDALGASEYEARPMQVLKSGASLLIPEGARVGLLCASDRWLELESELAWQLTETSCSEGRALTSGTYERMVPTLGRVLYNEISMVAEIETRENAADYGRIPVILSPRNSRLLDMEPQLRWVEVPGAVEYALKLLGPGEVFAEITLEPEELSCNADDETPYRICSVAWPVADWQLDEGQTYALTIGARMNLAGALRDSADSHLILVPEGEAEQIRTARADIERLGVDQITQDIFLAKLYSENELFGDAIQAYQRVIDIQSSPELYVALGDLFGEIALLHWAFGAYEDALAAAAGGEGAAAVRAASEFGIGRIYYSDQNYFEAMEHYKVAVDLYEQLGAGEERQKAIEGWANSRDRLSIDNSVDN
jgi:tetratricopeptide (TPR) repeat protein